MKTANTRRFDMANYLQSDDDIAVYLDLVLEDGDAAELAAALGHIARAKGMAQLAQDTGLSRESLYKALSGHRTPSADTLMRVIRGLGFRLSIQPH
ncbi:MAG: putative addiction module antidote protein [Hydrogenophaga sp.]|uniref:addiction module antidote protein n=1 Tax=Hydrogenophaga sp. TaxID=1904254 RepID=UPI00169F8601|nr:addiction module antidote protein [Hydrogenophaga sp.]NIM42328.1 putative addiction module antidote protein [Hydrogenophaga sp.]NIN28060.1 putative addiction module antidote protein [Hydrogenophaga sp.]NIN32838.1 putative addiction module antidote protein [Hydrogenophaga sp.]NIN54727.1 putative addiction module antidote protein [Hydrogenophaga sp.]NIO51403.1 putative addiction module antidote protein [Hydrogenophaga sp.]